MKKYHIQTFGCQMNEHDSETLAGMMDEMGFQEEDDKNVSDIVIINTCSIRENADKRFFGTLGQLKKTKEANPEFIVAVCGCMMQQQHVIDTLKSKYPWVDLVFGTLNIHEFPTLLQNVIDEKRKFVEVYQEEDEIVEGLPSKRKYKHKAFVNITFGCNNFCTYCIVPYTRGRERSRDPNQIVQEIKNLVKDGVREVTLLGQNVNSYGNHSDFTTTFADLVYRINEIDDLERIRFMTSHPKDLSDQLVLAYKECEKLSKHIHLPVQSGSNDVLKKMNRNYTREEYLVLVEKLRNAVPDIAITTDIIVGFPGETEKDFEETLELVETVRFDSAFTFLYSMRKGTPAEKYANQIPEEIKHKRFNHLVDSLNRIIAEKNMSYMGQIVPVILDGPSKTDPKTYTGRTDTFKLVNCVAEEEDMGHVLPVKITEAKTFSLMGEIVR